jgi:hypothetical protein
MALISGSRDSRPLKDYPKPELLKSFKTIKDSCGSGLNMVLTVTTDMNSKYSHMIQRARVADGENLEEFDRASGKVLSQVRLSEGIKDVSFYEDHRGVFWVTYITSSSGSGFEFSVVVEGDVCNLNPLVRDEAYWIGHEALVNALHHAGAKRIEVEIAYDPSHLRLRFRDDGSGIDPKIIEAGGKPGHWGMRGMRERAAKIGAHLETWSRPGAGTELELKIPGSVAYNAQGNGSLWRQCFREATDGISAQIYCMTSTIVCKSMIMSKLCVEVCPHKPVYRTIIVQFCC